MAVRHQILFWTWGFCSGSEQSKSLLMEFTLQWDSKLTHKDHPRDKCSEEKQKYIWSLFFFFFALFCFYLFFLIGGYFTILWWFLPYIDMTLVLSVHARWLSHVRLHALQPARLLCLWNFPGRHTGVGCHKVMLIYLPYRSV